MEYIHSLKRFNLGFLQKRKKNSDYFQHVTDFPKHFFCFCWPSFSFLSIVLIYAHSIWDLQIWDLQIFIGFKAFLSFQKHFFFLFAHQIWHYWAIYQYSFTKMIQPGRMKDVKTCLEETQIWGKCFSKVSRFPSFSETNTLYVLTL